MNSLFRAHLTSAAFGAIALAGCGGSGSDFSGLTVVAPPGVTAGAEASVLVLAKSAVAAPLSTYQGSVTLDADDPQAVITPSSYSFTAADAGAHAFTVVFKTAGKHTLHVIDNQAHVEASQPVEVASAAAAKLVILSGDGQQGTGGKPLSAPLLAVVTDAYGNVVGGKAVTWATTGGDGSVKAQSAATDADGQASATATLGAGPVSNAFTASAEGLSPVTFKATRKAYQLKYTDPTAGTVRLVQSPASTATQVVLDFVVAVAPALPAYAAGFNLPLDVTRVTLDANHPFVLPGKLALDPGSAPRPATAALPLSGPLAGNLVTVLSQKAAGAGAVPSDTKLAAGAVLYSVTLNLQPNGSPGVVFDGTKGGLVTSGGLRNKVGDAVVPAKDVGIGKLEVVE